MADRWTRIWWVRPLSRVAVSRVLGAAGRIAARPGSGCGPPCPFARDGHPGRRADRAPDRRVDHPRLALHGAEDEGPVAAGHPSAPPAGPPATAARPGSGPPPSGPRCPGRAGGRSRGGPGRTPPPPGGTRARGTGPGARGPACPNGARSPDGPPGRRACRPPRSRRGRLWTTSKDTAGSASGRLARHVLRVASSRPGAPGPGGARCGCGLCTGRTVDLRPGPGRHSGCSTAEREISASSATARSTRTPSRDDGTEIESWLTWPAAPVPADQ